VEVEDPEVVVQVVPVLHPVLVDLVLLVRVMLVAPGIPVHIVVVVVVVLVPQEQPEPLAVMVELEEQMIIVQVQM
jgi:hypothetical protein